MSAPKKDAPIETLLAQAGRAHLAPLGFVRQGRSRTWLLDRGFWLIMVEFQPSAYSKASFLNVGACWLWTDNEFLSFDYGSRVGNLFFEYKSEAQFRPKADVLGQEAAKTASDLLARFASPSGVASSICERTGQMLTTKGYPAWELLHAGTVCGLTGQTDRAASYLRLLVDEEASHDWQKALRAEAARRLELLSNREAFRNHITDVIAHRRALNKLSVWNDPLASFES